jgi:hypothetical protein
VFDKATDNTDLHEFSNFASIEIDVQDSLLEHKMAFNGDSLKTQILRYKSSVQKEYVLDYGFGTSGQSQYTTMSTP